MNKAIVILATSSFLMAGSAFAAQETVTGKSSLKLSSPSGENAVRSARKAIVEIDKEIVTLDAEIVDARNQAMTYKALNNNGPVLAKQMEALASAKEIQKSELAAQRGELQAVIQAE
ncbi:MAG: hypothetical protein ACXVA9_03155 [Bdellovibrionales bacterium]